MKFKIPKEKSMPLFPRIIKAKKEGESRLKGREGKEKEGGERGRNYKEKKEGK